MAPSMLLFLAASFLSFTGLGSFVMYVAVIKTSNPALYSMEAVQSTCSYTQKV
jgi:hypothetical protein